jgi:hypothetical protein
MADRIDAQRLLPIAKDSAAIYSHTISISKDNEAAGKRRHVIIFDLEAI